MQRDNGFLIEMGKSYLRQHFLKLISQKLGMLVAISRVMNPEPYCRLILESGNEKGDYFMVIMK